MNDFCNAFFTVHVSRRKYIRRACLTGTAHLVIFFASVGLRNEAIVRDLLLGTLENTSSEFVKYFIEHRPTFLIRRYGIRRKVVALELFEVCARARIPLLLDP